MAAALAQVRNALQAIGIVDASHRDAITESITSVEDFVFLTDKFIKDMCNTLRRPGGTVPNPNAAQPGAPAVIPCSGVAISPTAEERLILLGYYIRHLKRTSRPIPGQFVAARVLSMAEIKRREEEDKTLSKDATAPSMIDDLKKIREAFENIEDYLSKVRGTTGVPLRHVIRDDDEVPDDPDNMYPSVLDEMIARCPHDGEDFAADNNQVWSVIRACTHGGPAWSWVSAHARSRNGRAAWLALRSHYLGPTNQSKIMNKAEGDLENKFYSGERRNFSFERFAEIHQQAHTDLDEFGEPLTEAAKVRKFLKRIKAPSLESAIATVRATTALKMILKLLSII
jgi:phosphoglycolate phosphatase-like HAD superfamily hydrolase